MKEFRRLLVEIRRIYNVLPFKGFLKWMWFLIKALPRVLKEKSLGIVDDGFGESFHVRFEGETIRFVSCSFGVVREIFGANCYGRPGDLGECRTIVDFGANVGVFTIFALVANKRAHVYSVEAQPEILSALKDNLKANCLESRCTVTNKFIGAASSDWARAFRESHPHLTGLDVESFFAKLEHVDFLKCDIEGSEHSLFDGYPSWTGRISKLAVEYHWTDEDGENLRQVIAAAGFDTRLEKHGSLGYVFGTARSMNSSDE